MVSLVTEQALLEALGYRTCTRMTRAMSAVHTSCVDDAPVEPSAVTALSTLWTRN